MTSQSRTNGCDVLTHHMPILWTRRGWLVSQTVPALALVTPSLFRLRPHSGRATVTPAQETRAAFHAAHIDAPTWQALAQQAVDAAQTAGAAYADVRLTRTVRHQYGMGGLGALAADVEVVGIGIRALVQGYWGFAAQTVFTPDAVVRVARDAVTQAKENAKGPPRTADVGTIPIATGTWTTPIRIDPFTVSIEEKLDTIAYWNSAAHAAGVPLRFGGASSWLQCVRQERVLATSGGTLITQTCYETGAWIESSILFNNQTQEATAHVDGIAVAGAGWELLIDAKIPDRFVHMHEQLQQKVKALGSAKPVTVGRYTLVCDGQTMASLVEQTLGVATQLDRALGYEADSGGTSFIDDPFAMVGQLHVTTPLVTVTANRSAPAQLATVQWDDEGVTPETVPLIKSGVLTDFQTTREQAAWLAPYYQRQGMPVRSHGHASAEDALAITMQHMPNLALAPNAAEIRLEDLAADVPDGILIERGVASSDAQARTGLLDGDLRQIKNGRLGRMLTNGTVRFNTANLWKNITAIGGPSTEMVYSQSQYDGFGQYRTSVIKGQPPQRTSHSVRAAAATILNQPIINPDRKAS